MERIGRRVKFDINLIDTFNGPMDSEYGRNCSGSDGLSRSESNRVNKNHWSETPKSGEHGIEQSQLFQDQSSYKLLYKRIEAIC
ncbi:hypothetical protein CHT99_06295 [Sphingobacterium cellulitidis]|nr:hypothetical protein CHT99_06295 [Sphingobacterium cellulitidis]